MTRTIEARDLTVRYGDTTAVDGLSFRLEGGRIHGLLGRNGSGKTSLLSVLAAFRRATSGEVTIDGQPVFENADVVRDICFIRGPGDTVTHDWPVDRVRNALEFASVVRPQWDSYLGMDAPSRYAFYDLLLADVAEHPRTFVISTHLIEEVARLFEQVLIIDHGRLLLQSDADDLRERGATITGPTAVVDRHTTGLDVLSARHLGPTKSVTVFGALAPEQRREATQDGLEIGPVAIQDLFVHLTDPVGAPADDRSAR